MLMMKVLMTKRCKGTVSCLPLLALVGMLSACVCMLHAPAVEAHLVGGIPRSLRGAAQRIVKGLAPAMGRSLTNHTLTNHTDDDMHTYDDCDDDFWDDHGPDCGADCLTTDTLMRVLRTDGSEQEVEMRVDALRVGDLVQTVNAQGAIGYAPVAYLVHKREAALCDRTRVTIRSDGDGSESELRVTEDHLVAMVPCDAGTDPRQLQRQQQLVPAHRVEQRAEQEGMCVVRAALAGGAGLQVANVTSVRMHEHHMGFMTVVTSEPSGIIVAEGHVVSSFGTNHLLTNWFYQLHRLVFRISPAAADSSDALYALTEGVAKTTHHVLALTAALFSPLI